MPAFKTLVYSPDVQVVVAGKNGMIDISADLVGGDVQRAGEGVSFVSLRLANKGLRYNNAFRRMDRIVVRMKRVKWVTVFSGYLNRVPSIQLYPGVVGIQASCTLKRLKYTYWDPGLTPSAELFNQFGTDLANGGENKDAGMGFMLKNILKEVGGWAEDDVIVQPFPTAFIDYLADGASKYKDTRSEALKKFKELFDYDEATGAAGSGGAAGVANGNLADATFTSIGAPANGVAYSNEEIVWIVTNAGWSGEDVVIGSSIIKAESSGNPAAVNNNNPDGSIDRGLWQINSVHDGKYPGENRFDPAVSTKIARDLYHARGNWDDWSTLVYHGTAQGHFNTFRPLVASGGVAPPGSGTSGPVIQKAAPGRDPQTNQPLPAAAPPPAGVSVPYGLPTGSNVSYSSGGFPDWVYALGQQFNLQASTYPGHQEGAGSGPGYAPNPNRQNRGIDWSGSVADMQRFAEYLYGIAPGTPALEQIIWMNPNTGQKIGWAGRSPDTSGSYYRDDYGGHQDHVHTRQNASLDGSGNMTGAAPGDPGTAGGGAGASAFQNKLAKNLFGYLFDPTDFYNETSAWYVDDETGARSSINDVPLLESVVAICRARMCKYMSAPTGEFLAYYPDYFGLDGTPAKLDLEDIELKNFGVDLNDDNVVTHMFVAGLQEYGGQANASDIGWMATSGIATIMDEWLFDRVIGASVSAPDVTEAGEFLERFGIRPLKEQYADIRGTSNPGIELMIAVQRFMQKWAEQSLTNVEMTFMPELFPGMRVNLVGHDITVYVNAVNHSFDFQSGFRTTASIMAPSKTSAFVLPKKEGDG